MPPGLASYTPAMTSASTTAPPPSSLPRTVEVLEGGRTGGLHPGAQLAVWVGDELVADLALGEARAGVPMTTRHMAIWWSMTKATVAVSIAMMWEQGKLDIEQPVASYVPEFAVNGKESLTLRHLLTHTGGFRDGDRVSSQAQDPGDWWDETVAGICAAGLEAGWVPGRDAGYHLFCSMQILAECIRRVDGRRYDSFVRDELFLPLGMNDCWVGMPADAIERYGDLIGTMHNTSTRQAIALEALDSPTSLGRSMPGGYGRGPMNQLVRLYRMLANEGELDGVRVLSPQTVAAIGARHRTGTLDKTFGVPMDWGLGFNVDGGAMGRHCSPRTFGHGGAQSSIAFVDPEYRLAAAIQTNGMPGNEAHYIRFNEITTALYDDLGLAWAGPAGRDKPLPGEGMASV